MNFCSELKSRSDFAGDSAKLWETLGGVNRKLIVTFNSPISHALAWMVAGLLLVCSAHAQRPPDLPADPAPAPEQPVAPLDSESAPADGSAEASPSGPAPLEADVPPPVDSVDESTESPANVDQTETEVPDADPSALSDFRPHLDPYGEWVEHPIYGTVWVPHDHVVGTRFAPYVSRGHWALTPDEQWIWVSDYPFGWVTFHYGRWVWVQGPGWVWIPGRRYAHAWVTFRVSDGPYIGWAPMPPRYIWRSGVAVWIGHVPPTPYVFVSSHYVFYPSVYSYVIYEHYRVRPLVRRSHRYWPRGAHHGHYYSPPVRHIPAKARPAGRTQPSEKATSLRRYVAPRRAGQSLTSPRQGRRSPARPSRTGATGQPWTDQAPSRIKARPKPYDGRNRARDSRANRPARRSKALPASPRPFKTAPKPDGTTQDKSSTNSSSKSSGSSTKSSTSKSSSSSQQRYKKYHKKSDSGSAAPRRRSNSSSSSNTGASGRMRARPSRAR